MAGSMASIKGQFGVVLWAFFFVGIIYATFGLEC